MRAVTRALSSLCLGLNAAGWAAVGLAAVGLAAVGLAAVPGPAAADTVLSPLDPNAPWDQAGDPAAVGRVAQNAGVQAALAGVGRSAAALFAKHGYPGMAVAVTYDGRTIFTAGYGVADLGSRKAATPETPFRLASISKLFTALAVVQLRDAGRLSLDDRVSAHLPGFRLAGDPTPAITIRELLLQLGGLPREPLSASWQTRQMPDGQELMADLDAQPAAIPRESEWKYSNLGYALLGQLVTAVSHQSFAEYVRAHITRPLGMDRTTVDPQAAPDLATGYDERPGDMGADGQRAARPIMAMAGVAGAAGVVSTASDLAKFAAFFLSERDSPVLSRASRREMMRVQAIFPEWNGGQGLGFEIRHLGGRDRVGHAGLGAGYAGRLDLDPQAGLGVVVLMNADEAGATSLADQIFGQLLNPLATAEAAQTPPPVADPAWSAYLGRYTSQGHQSEIALVGGRLCWQDPEAADPARTRVYLEPAGPNVFRFMSGALVGETLTFEFGPDARVAAMHAAGTTDRKL